MEKLKDPKEKKLELEKYEFRSCGGSIEPDEVVDIRELPIEDKKETKE